MGQIANSDAAAHSHSGTVTRMRFVGRIELVSGEQFIPMEFLDLFPCSHYRLDAYRLRSLIHRSSKSVFALGFRGFS